MTLVEVWLREIELVRLDELKALIPPHVVEEGRRLAKKRVSGLMPTHDGGVSASVKAGTNYTPSVSGATADDFQWECSCVVSRTGKPCAHAAAVVAAVEDAQAAWGTLPRSRLLGISRPKVKTVFRAGALSSDMGESALRAWADSAGVATLLDERVDDHGAAIRAFTGTWVYGHETLGELALGEDPSGKAPELVLRYLLHAAEQVQVRRRSDLVLLETAPAEGPRRVLWDRLVALRPKAPIPLSDDAPDSSEADLVAAGFTLRWNRPCGASNARSVTLTVTADPNVPAVSCRCTGGLRASCTFVRPALDAVLRRLITDDASVDLAIDAATRPLWSRQLDVAHSRMGDVAESEVGYNVMVDDDGAPQVRPVVVSTGAGKRRAAFRQFGLRDLDTVVLRPLDRAVLALLEGDASDEQHRAALALLIGHPRVFLDGTAAATAKGDARLRIEPAPSGFRVALELGAVRRPLRELPVHVGVLVLAMPASESATELARIEVFELSDRLRRSIAALTPLSTDLPSDALPTVLRRVAEWGLLGQTQVDAALAAEGRDSPTEPVVRLEWRKPAVDVRVGFYHHPDYPVLMPDEGPDELFVRTGDRSERLWRSRASEVDRASDVAYRLGLPLQGGFRWLIGNLDAALDLVRAATRLEGVRVEWAGGKPLIEAVPAEAVAIVIEPGRNWFKAGGAVNIRGDAVPLDLLLRAIAERQRYVEVGEGVYATIEDRLLAPLAALAGIRSKSGEIPSVGAAVVADLEAAGATVEGVGASWVSRLRDAESTVPTLPSELRADLRHYQQVGFEWMARLAAWAPGACLCDDMGLGKTVQSIALLLLRRAAGPILVVAPTSVGFNWSREIDRFAPGFELRTFRGKASLPVLDGLAAGIVVVTNYELLAGHEAAFHAVTWGTVVFDEAQAIKNPGTARSRAAHGLDAGFRLALTGTPVENRVDELWSIFQATVPGLLGAADTFRERFATPIGKQKDPAASELLAHLIRPFVLRRLKSEVATELPPRTDIQVDIELSELERARYDQLRLAALQAIAKAKAADKPGEAPEDPRESGQRRIQVLAALTRLRQAACHPRLLDPTSVEPSTKLSVLLELIEQLRSEGHRALVFSQFARHLELVRESLVAADIPYRLLDGATPAAKRRQEVDLFQAGHGDVFLISLKAGGTGLNLTGADYVIHLDPWWNPAIEDQATDRAHRIGQTRPVTVYRLVAKATIEESILALHAEKRELVSGLLGGTDQPTQLTTDDLVALLAT